MSKCHWLSARLHVSFRDGNSWVSHRAGTQQVSSLARVLLPVLRAHPATAAPLAIFLNPRPSLAALPLPSANKPGPGASVARSPGPATLTRHFWPLDLVRPRQGPCTSQGLSPAAGGPCHLGDGRAPRVSLQPVMPEGPHPFGAEVSELRGDEGSSWHIRGLACLFTVF